MPRPAVELPRTDPALDPVARALAKILPEWARGSRLIEAVAVSTTPVYVAHKLGRAHRGWILARVVGAAAVAVWELQTTDAAYKADLAATHLQLDAGATGTVSVVVF
jgi:hypothetical protein